MSVAVHGSLTSLSVAEMQRLLRARAVSALELTRAHLARIAAIDPRVQAFLTVTEERAEAQARQADERIAAGEQGALLGIPMALKDVLLTRDIQTTAGSRMLEGFKPLLDATITRRLWDAGAVLLGKTNMDEFAMGSSTENSGYFPTRNPWDLERVPGGSSGGSAASVSAEMAACALGTDTGGSIRQPAALCGLVGLKPTYGRVSRFGLIAFASSLDQIGPFTRTVEDAARVMNALAGHDACDSTSLDVPVPDYAASLGGESLKGLRLGLPKEYVEVQGMEAGVRTAIDTAVRQLERLGAEIEAVSLPHTEYGLATYYLIAPAECSANLARFDGVKYGLSIRSPLREGQVTDSRDRASLGQRRQDQDLSPAGADTLGLWEMYQQSRGRGFGPEVKRRIMLGTYALSSGYYDAYYLKAQQARTLIKQDFDAVFERCDAVISPTSPNVAFPLGAKTQDPLAMYLNDLFTIPASLAGLPAISVPAGFSDGLPVGLQVIGKALDESTLLRVAHAYEQSTDWHRRKPMLATALEAVSARGAA